MFNCFRYRYIDFIFIMAYDMHGPWEGKQDYIPDCMLPTTTQIKS